MNFGKENKIKNKNTCFFLKINHEHCYCNLFNLKASRNFLGIVNSFLNSTYAKFLYLDIDVTLHYNWNDWWSTLLIFIYLFIAFSFFDVIQLGLKGRSTFKSEKIKNTKHKKQKQTK